MRQETGSSTISKFATFALPIIHLVYPPTFAQKLSLISSGHHKGYCGKYESGRSYDSNIICK